MPEPARRAGESPPSGSLAERWAGFLAYLRDEGVLAGTGAGVDLGLALAALPALDRTAARDACVTTLAKNPSEATRVRRAFDEFFAGHPVRAVPASPPPPSTRPPGGRASERSLGARTGTTVERGRTVLLGQYSPQAPGTDRPLGAIPPRALDRFRIAARALQRSRATHPGRRRRRSPHGPVDLPATVRASLRRHGEWILLRHRERRLSRVRYTVLWDVSGSMTEHRDEMFGLVYALRRSAPRSRVFAFADGLVELTSKFGSLGYARTRETVGKALPAAGGGTQIGDCLTELVRRFPSAVGPQTTVMVLSDGWDQGETAPLVRILERVRRSAAALLWVNPHAGEVGFSPDTAAIRAALPLVEMYALPRGRGSSPGWKPWVARSTGR